MPLASMSKVTSILRHAARSRLDAVQVESAQQAIVGRHRAFALEDLHGHGRLIVVGRREDLLLRLRNGRVLFDDLGEDAAQGLDAQRQRRDVEQQHFGFAAEQKLGPLNGGADGDDLIGIDALVAFLAEDFLDQLLHARHAGHAADQYDFVDVLGRVAGIFQGRQHGATAAFDRDGPRAARASRGSG